MSEGKTVLIKVGGSLLSLSDLAERLRRLFDATKASTVLIVPGGGEVTDVVRNWDQLHSLATEASHQLAIDSLGLTARLLASVLPEATLTDANLLAALPTSSRSRHVAILDVPSILARSDCQESPADCQESPELPSGWHVTSDSISAWIAIHWQVDELVLAKSTHAPDVIWTDSAHSERDEADRSVDSAFGKFLPSLPPLFWCDLRGDPAKLFAFETSSDGNRLFAVR